MARAGAQGRDVTTLGTAEKEPKTLIWMGVEWARARVARAGAQGRDVTTLDTTEKSPMRPILEGNTVDEGEGGARGRAR